MALGTGAIGLIPTFDQIGLSAAIILFCLRMVQGLCLGGQYGGAITYVAEHVSDERRGYYTGWLQTSPTLGIVLSLLVIIVTRTYLAKHVFNAWAWRIPFLFSFLLVFIAFYIRGHFEESPIYAEIKAKGETSKNPWREAFLNPANIKFVMIATIVVLGQGVVWYSGQFWALYFLQQVSKVDAADHRLDCRSRPCHRHAVADLLRLAVRQDRPQAGDPGRHVPCGGHLLSAVCVARRRSPSRATSTRRSRSSSSPSWSAMWAWFTARSARSSPNISPAASATPRCRCPITSATAGAADWCRSSPRRPIRRPRSIGYALIYPIAVPAVCLVLGLFLMPETHKTKIWGPTAA